MSRNKRRPNPPHHNNGHQPPTPSDDNAERALLGAAMVGAAHQLTSLPETLWYRPAHRHIAQAITATADTSGTTDAVLVAGHLREQGLLDEIGGLATLAQCIADAPPPSAAPRYINLLEQLHQARNIIDAAHQATTAAQQLQLDEAHQHLALHTPRHHDTLERHTLADTFNQPPPHPDTIIDGLIEAGEQLALAAPRAIGKSFLAMNLAALVAQGAGQLAGTLAIRRRVNVLYCHGELNPYNAYARWYRMHHGQTPAPGLIETFERWRARIIERRTTAPGGGTDTHFEGILDPRLEQAIVEDQIGLLIINPWAVYYAGRENSNDETEAVLDKLRDLTLRHKIAVVILHHISAKANRNTLTEPEDLWRGATRLADWASTRITMLRHYTDHEAAELQLTRQEARRFVDVRILRRGEPTPDFSMQMNHQTGWWESWEPHVVADLTSAEIAARCAASPTGHWESQRAAASALGVDRKKATALLDKAVEEGHLIVSDGCRNSARYEPNVEML